MRARIFKRPEETVADLGVGEDMLAGISETDGPPATLVAGEAPVAPAPHTGSASAVLTAERAVVGAVLRDNTLFDLVIDILRPDDFLDAAARAVFKSVAGIIEGRVPGTTVAEPITVAVQPGIVNLVSMSRLEQWAREADATPDVVSGRARVIRSAAAERGLGAAVVQAQSILAEDGSIESKSDEILKLLSGASEIRSLPVTSLGAAALEAVTELAERAKSGDTGMGIPTGFHDLDALTAGLHGGQLIVLAARPGVGKTALALSVGMYAAEHGHATVMASLEMKARELSKRALAISSGLDSHAIRIGALSERDWELLVDATQHLNTLPFDIVDLPNVNLSGLAGLCRRLHREGRLKLLIVDYLQIMETSGTKGANREQLVAELSRGLKKLAMMLDIPVVVLSQLSRAVEGRASKRPQLSDLRESGAIEQDADVVIFVHREDVADKSGLSEGIADIIVEKQRAGSAGEVQARFNRRTTGFSDINSVHHLDPLRLAA